MLVATKILKLRPKAADLTKKSPLQQRDRQLGRQYRPPAKELAGHWANKICNLQKSNVQPTPRRVLLVLNLSNKFTDADSREMKLALPRFLVSKDYCEGSHRQQRRIKQEAHPKSSLFNQGGSSSAGTSRIEILCGIGMTVTGDPVFHPRYPITDILQPRVWLKRGQWGNWYAAVTLKYPEE